VSNRPGFEPEVDRIIREAIEEGEFDHLAGAGRPLPGAGEKDDPFWWVRSWVARGRSSEEE